MVYEKDRLGYYFENTTRGSFRSVQESLITSFQHGLLKIQINMDVSGRIRA
jgi:hypothetical protein